MEYPGLNLTSIPAADQGAQNAAQHDVFEGEKCENHSFTAHQEGNSTPQCDFHCTVVAYFST